MIPHKPSSSSTMIYTFTRPNKDEKTGSNAFKSSSKYILTYSANRMKSPLLKNYVQQNKTLVHRKSKSNLSMPNRYHLKISIDSSASDLSNQESFYFSRKKKKENIKTVQNIVDSLLSDDPTVDLPMKNTKNKIKSVTEINTIQRLKDIDPKKYIAENYKSEPENKEEFKSYNIQVDSLGSQHNRVSFLEGVNSYVLNQKTFRSLKRNDICNITTKSPIELEMDQKPKRGFYFSLDNKRAKKKYVNYYFSNYMINMVSPTKIKFLPTIDEIIEKNMNSVNNTFDKIKEISKEFGIKKVKINSM